MRIAILAPAEDLHALVVARALRARNFNVALLNSVDGDAVSEFSMALCPRDGVSLWQKGSITEPADVVWFRRPIPAPWNLPADPRSKEVHGHRDGFLSALASQARLSVNPMTAALRMESKLEGLLAARAAGFPVPSTLMSADPEAVRAFFDRHDGQVVFKTHRPQPHVVGKARGTAALPAEIVDNAAAISAQPGIYQQRLTVRHELRVLVLGRTVRVVKVVNRSRFVDARIMLGAGNEVSLAEVPVGVTDRCIALVRQNGLVSASIDLACDPEGELVFLDLNPSGQFLWMEEYCPEIDVLDTFANFLASGDPDFAGAALAGNRQTRLSEFVD